MGFNVPLSAIQKEGGVFKSKINIVKGVLADAEGEHRWRGWWVGRHWWIWSFRWCEGSRGFWKSVVNMSFSWVVWWAVTAQWLARLLEKSQTTFAQSRLLSVSTSSKFIGLEESRSRHLSIFQVLKSLGLGILCILRLADSLSIHHLNYQYYFDSIWSNHE